MHYPTFDRDHFGHIAEYEYNVLEGARAACLWERLAVERHIKDMDRAANDPNYPYRFDFAKALEAIHFMECFPHVKGKWSRAASLQNKLIELSPWQKWIAACIFGWVKKSDGLRRFSLAYICVPRKNGKSIFAALVGLYLYAADGEPGAEVYCGATNKDQAKEVFVPARLMAIQQADYCEAYDIGIHKGKLFREHDGAVFEPVIGDPGDGSSPHCWIADEYHEHKDDRFVDTMQTGQGAREQGLGLIITTAGFNHEGPCYAQQEELQRVLKGDVVDDELFGIIYTIDKDVDWKSDRALEMANPNWGVSVIPGRIRPMRDRAIVNVRKQGAYKTKHLNQWVSSKDAWLNPEDWLRGKVASDFDWDQFIGEESGLGLDLSESKDLTAKVNCFKQFINGKPHYFFKSKSYTTEAQAAEKKDLYGKWVDEGLLHACDGNMIDYDDVRHDVGEDAENYIVEQVFFDPKGAAYMAQQLKNDLDIEPVRFEQNYTNFTPIMNDFEALLLDGRIHHDGNPCFSWMVENMIAKETMDGKGKRPVKPSKDKKIDAGVAMLLSFAAVYVPDDEQVYESVYNQGEL